ncbi:MAG: FAD-dependent oxidoreductase [Phycisphaerales bacterium]|nr:FAD-dependent oxidoreductase [Phycisphaerales bacterium]
MPPKSTTSNIDTVIFGGGVSGLWLLAHLTKLGHAAVLLESHELGRGQTVASQGIVHGGFKYSLSGLVTRSARQVSNLPQVWRRCLAGEQHPKISNTRMRAEFCYLWQTQSLKSRLSMLSARAMLKVSPTRLTHEATPEILNNCPGQVYRLDEQVLEPASLIADLADQMNDRILRINTNSGLEIVCSEPGQVRLIRLMNPDTGEPLDLEPRNVIFTAGIGNAALRRVVGLDAATLQRRPLHMVVAKGNLPRLNGHCIDGGRTRVTITTTQDFRQQNIWQLGGQIAEQGVNMETASLVEHAIQELSKILPAFDPTGTQWSTYRVDRAEERFRGHRPSDACVHRRGNVITAWPTKMVLAPRLAEKVVTSLTNTSLLTPANSINIPARDKWPRPDIAMPPWETPLQWITND